MQAGGRWPRKRPDRWQHPTTRHGIPDVFPCPEGGVHRWLLDYATAGISAPYVFEGAINGERFRAYIEQMLAPTLAPGDIVLLDNGPLAASVRKFTVRPQRRRIRQ